MTVSRATTLLFSFRSKIEEAVSLVPRMHPEAKLKAVQFWNIVSEKLQDIVNNSAADISAVALKMDEANECADKLNMELNNSSNFVIPQNNEPTPDFMNVPPSYNALYSESSTQFHNADITNTDLKQLLPSESAPSSAEENPDNNEINDIPQHHQTNIINNVPNNENQQTVDNFLEIASMHSVSEISGVKTRICNSETKVMQSERNINCGQYVSSEEQNFIGTDCSNEKSCDSSSSKRTSARLKELKKKIDFKSFIDCSDDSYEGNTSDIDPNFCLEDSNEHNAERIVRCVSNIRKLLEPNEDSRQENNENKMQEDSEEMSNSDSKSLFACKICIKLFSDSESLANHNSLHDKPYTCTDCQASFASKGNLSVHIRKHTGEKPYSCDECGARFSTQGNLKRHLKTHTGEKPWKCEQCFSTFTEKKSLIVHMRRHTGERPYQCKICGKRFAQTGILQTHMAMHLDIKVHLCELCGKSFRQKSQLRIHKLRHDNIRKYGCSSCTSFFLTKGDLERHKRQHTGEKPFVCDVCKKTFTRQQSLNEHLNRHYGIKPYVCKHCGKAFVEMSACHKHVKLHTNSGNIEGWKKNALKINHLDEIPPSEVTSATRNTENELSNIEETPQYFAVVLNSKDASAEDNQSILFNPTNNENGLGVLTAINVLANTSSAAHTF
ncbi:zinc finger protein 568 [Trichonephila clavipes]|uniref:Zinc finger protein 568 n=1 Tax=Trichonephila clavipes TaxID=2585209 RepID=A0A8X7BLR1_TRICX|nr:zinc finger protein 568 [Trichonephila clavipes]